MNATRHNWYLANRELLLKRQRIFYDANLTSILNKKKEYYNNQSNHCEICNKTINGSKSVFDIHLNSVKHNKLKSIAENTSVELN